MKKSSLFIIFSLLQLLFLASCGRSAERKLDMARQLLGENPDSAYIVMRRIDYTDLDADSLRAKYVLTKALIHQSIGRSIWQIRICSKVIPSVEHSIQ